MHSLKDKMKKGKAPQGTMVGLEGTARQSTEPQSTSDLVIPEEPEDPDGLGLQVWSEPSVADGPLVDIVFVHGLTGKRTKTWLADGAARPWPQELLAQKIPEARILTYGYDADIVHLKKPAGLNTVLQHAKNLNGDLTRHRYETSSLDRPLIFVAHSLGGLVCEQAIVQSRDGIDDEEKRVSISLHGIIFMGTPHAGSDLIAFALSLGHIIQSSFIKSPNTSNLAVLQKDSEVLASLQNSFNLFFTTRERSGKRLAIHCFTEEYPVKNLGHRVVEPASAKFPGGHHTEESIPADHMNMTKFQYSYEIGYKRLSGRLRKWVDDIGNDPDLPQANAISLMPFAQDKDFVGREDILKSIDEGFSQSTTLRRIALAGLGGVGKSQIAIEYAYRLREKRPETSLFWVSANTAARFEQSYRSIATTAQIPGREDPKSDVLHLVNQWLGGGESGAWLLVLDNADDAELFFGPHETGAGTDVESPLLSQYLPQTGAGSILIISRDQATAFHLSGQSLVLQVGVMSMDDTFALLAKKLPKDPSANPVKEELIVELDSVPLAITQASVYIRVRAERMTIAKYLQLLRDGEQNQIKLLSNNEADLRRDPKVPNSVIRTWQITFSQIKTQNPEAADLLARMCMLDRQGIPEFLICQDGDQSLEFENAIAVLLQFSLVVEEKGKNMFAIHRLVQLATRTWIETCGALQRFQEDALSLVHHQYPIGNYEDWKTCEALEPHAQIVREYIFDSKSCQLQQADILFNEASYAGGRGRFSDAEKLVQKAIDIRSVHLELDDPELSDSLCFLAQTYNDLGRWKEAEEMATQALEQQKRVLGVEHPGTLATLGLLADTYTRQRRWTEAENLFQEVQEVGKRVLGAESPEMLRNTGGLATVYAGQRRWAEAEKLYMQGWEVLRRVAGAEHPETLTAMSDLAAIYGNQARWTEAENLNVQILEVRRRVLGAEHPDILVSMRNLASDYHHQNRHSEAIELLEKVVELGEKIPGANHPRTIDSKALLATWYYEQNRRGEAIELIERVVELEKKSLGLESPDTIIALLATWYYEQNRHSEAIELMEKVIELQRTVLGADHAERIVNMGWLANWYYKQNRRGEAIELMEKVVELSKKVCGPEHPNTVNSMGWLANWYHEQNRRGEAIDLMEEVVKLSGKVLGSEHPGTIGSTEALAEWKSTQSPI